MTSTNDFSRLSRRLNTSDAVIIGLGSMIGAGIFVSAGPASQAAGSGMLIGVLIAGILAFLNATTMAQLAAVYPQSGGAYVYGRNLLGPFWGFLAGWGFVIGKLASCTAMALSFAYYAAPEYTKPIAVISVLTLTIINYLGIKKTAAVTKIIVTLVLFSLLVVVLASLFGGNLDTARLSGWTDRGGLYGILQSAGMMFFAFAGYARVATLGEEVINPKETIPRAISISITLTFILYLIVMSTIILCLDMSLLTQSRAPLALAVESGQWSFFSPLVKFGACLASLGVLLSLMAGISRTIFAMSTHRDLPKKMSAIHSQYRVPHHAEVAVGLIVASVVAFADLRTSIGFSSFAILIYYAIANASSLRLSQENRLAPRWTSALGLVVCVVIALCLPKESIVGGVILFSLGSIYYYFNKNRSFT